MAGSAIGFQIAKCSTGKDLEGGRASFGEWWMVQGAEEQGQVQFGESESLDAPAVSDPGVNLPQGSGRRAEGGTAGFFTPAVVTGE